MPSSEYAAYFLLLPFTLCVFFLKKKRVFLVSQPQNHETEIFWNYEPVNHGRKCRNVRVYKWLQWWICVFARVKQSQDSMCLFMTPQPWFHMQAAQEGLWLGGFKPQRPSHSFRFIFGFFLFQNETLDKLRGLWRAPLFTKNNKERVPWWRTCSNFACKCVRVCLRSRLGRARGERASEWGRACLISSVMDEPISCPLLAQV